MIHVRTSLSPEVHGQPAVGDPTVHISFVGVEQIAKFEKLINKAINCAPEYGQEWFQLADNLHSFLARAKTPA